MKKSLKQRIVTAIVITAMVFSSLNPALAKGMPKTAPTAATGLNLSAAGTNLISNLLTGLRGRFGGGRINPLTTLPKDKYREILYGDDTTEYFLGVASQFAIFANTLSIESTADCEGRLAADELYVVLDNQYSVKGNMSDGSNPGEGVVADVVVNNAIQKKFGNISQNYGRSHLFVVSDQVTDFYSQFPDNADKIKANTYTVSTNGVIDFGAEMSELKKISGKLVNMTSGTVSGPLYSNLYLTGTDEKVNVFNIDGDIITNGNLNLVDISVPAGSFIIINVSGKEIAFQGNIGWAFKINGAQVGQSDKEGITHILFNAYEAEKIDLYSTHPGCLLAPYATVEDVAQGSHNYGQIIADEVILRHEMGAYGFLLPADDIVLPPDYFTAHYMYYDVNGGLHEFEDAFYESYIDKNTAPMPNNGEEGYENDDVLTGSEDALVAAFANLTDTNFNKDGYTRAAKAGLIRFRVYEDGNEWSQAVDDGNLCSETTYDSMKWVGDAEMDKVYTFEDSNVYFIIIPYGKVDVDVRWDDMHDKGDFRPDEFNVFLEEKVYDPATGNLTNKARDEKDMNKVSPKNDTIKDNTLNKDIEYDLYKQTYTFAVPLFGKQPGADGKLTNRHYGGGNKPQVYDYTNADNLFVITYNVPERYTDATLEVLSSQTNVNGDSNGLAFGDDNCVVAHYHIVLRGEYKAVFYIVDPDTNQRTEVYKDNFYTSGDYAKFRGYATTDVMPSLTNDEITKALANKNIDPVYTVTWKDIKTGRNYEASADEYEFDYEDVIFETTVRRAELMSNSPWLYVHIIRYMDSYYVPGKMLWKRLDLDGTTDPTKNGFGFIQKTDGQTTTDYSYESLRNGDYDDDEFFMFSFVYGIDTDRAVATRATVSTEGFGSDAKIFYEAEEMGVNDGGMTDTFLGMKGGSSLDIHKILEEDNYCQDYDGMRYFRLALPADEFVDKNLYFTVYYIDEDGQESVWFYYFFDMDNNKYWTIEAK